MGTLIAVVAISFHTGYFPAGTTDSALTQAQAVAQSICQTKHSAGQAVPMVGAIGMQTERGTQIVPAALFGCFVPDAKEGQG